MSAQNTNNNFFFGDVELYEFYLNYAEIGKPVIRVALGGLIDSKERKTLTPKYVGDPEFDTGNLTGEIGFMDIVLRQETVPQPGVTEYNLRNFWVNNAATVLTIGIEPDHRYKGYGSLLLHQAEQIASKEGINYVVIDGIINEREFPNMLGRRGYLLSDRGHRAVKDLTSDFIWMPHNLRANVLAAKAQLS